MAKVWIPLPLQALAGGEPMVETGGANVKDLIDGLDRRFPGIRAAILEDDTMIRRGISIVVDGNIVKKGLLHPVSPDSEVFFIPAIGGG